MVRCGAPWYSNTLIGGFRTVKSEKVKVCRSCYEHVRYEVRRLGIPLDVIMFADMEPKRPFLRRTKTSQCPRVGCGVKLPKKLNYLKLKRLGSMYVCRACWQAAWRLAKEKATDVEQAWELLPPRQPYFGRRKQAA